jgi:hypothetical protein
MSTVVVQSPVAPPVKYRPKFRGREWRDVSTDVRVQAWRCEACDKRPRHLSELQGAHLVSERELHDLGLRDEFLLDRRGVVSLCPICHLVLDVLVVGVRDPRWLHPSLVGRLRARLHRYAPAFKELAWRRTRVLVAMLREAEVA